MSAADELARLRRIRSRMARKRREIARRPSSGPGHPEGFLRRAIIQAWRDAEAMITKDIVALSEGGSR